MNRADLLFLETMFQMPVSQIPFQLLIVNQSLNPVLESPHKNIRVINDAHFGLSRSRNMALAACKARFAWILDDDVRVLNRAVDLIVDNINVFPQFNLFLFKITTPTGQDKREYTKQNSALTRVKQLKQIHSIEMVLDTHYLKANHLKFDIRFGLGAPFKMGEEYVIARELLLKNGKIIAIPESIVAHNDVSTGYNPVLKDVVYAQGALAAYDNHLFIHFRGLKYLVSVFIRGYVKHFKDLLKIFNAFVKGAEDYLNTKRS